jgi:UDP-N-acetylglucosamine 3-dehydrogenase
VEGASVNRPLRIGLVSCAHVHASGLARAIASLRPRALLAGIYDEEPERTGSLLQELRAHSDPDVQLHDLPALLERSDAVVIASTNADHRRYTEAAAAAGVHVLCEKPLATTLADARAMIEACRSAGVQLGTAFPVRSSAAVLSLKDAINGGRMGRILAARCTNPGRFPGGWFGDPAKAGGGAVMDHTVHVADLLRWLLHDEVERVEAEVGSYSADLGVDDTGILLLDLVGGAFASIDCSWSRPKTFPTWGGLTLHVVGEQATIDVDVFRQAITHYDDSTSDTRLVTWGDDLNRLMVAGFVDAILAGRPVPISGEDGMRALEVAIAAYRSSEERRPVAIADL